MKASNFDVEGGQFEFSKYDMDQEREKCAQLQQKQKSQGKKVNHKVMNMIDRSVCSIILYSC